MTMHGAARNGEVFHGTQDTGAFYFDRKEVMTCHFGSAVDRDFQRSAVNCSREPGP